MKKIKSILELKDSFDVFAFDVWGTIWDGSKLIGNIADVMKDINATKKIVVISNSAEAEKDIEATFEKRGLKKGVHYTRVCSSGDLFKEKVLNKITASFFSVGKKIYNIFEGTQCSLTDNIENADYAIVGHPRVLEGGEWKAQFSVEPFMDDLKKLKTFNKTLYCTNPDLLTPVENSDIPAIQYGAIAKAYEDMGGKVIYYGKPHFDIYEYALLGEDKTKTIMIGDTLEADIKGGIDYGIKTAFVTTGISIYNMKEEGFDNLDDYIKALNIIPDYII